MIRRVLAALSASALLGASACADGPPRRPVANPVSAQAAAAGCVVLPPVAHRGGTESYVENTGNAFRDAHNRGVSAWETDVRFTADDVPVLLHDPQVDRTTSGSGDVSGLTYAQLMQMRTDDDQPVLTLRQFINDAQTDAASKLLVELKTLPTAAQWAAVNAALNSRPAVASRIILMSFDAATLSSAATNAPSYQRALVQSTGDVEPNAVLPYAKILVKHQDAITTARLSKWRAAGLSVYAWTVDAQTGWERMAWYPGLSGVITNRPAAYLAWQRSRSC
jgi:glycerophosphoryl diester phosphodiesterase